jgi:hypothetical protein
MAAARPSSQCLQLGDHALDQRKPDAPKPGVAGVEAEWLEQFRIRLGAAGCEQREVSVCETLVRALIDAV